jgi:hypothetical protein
MESLGLSKCHAHKTMKQTIPLIPISLLAALPAVPCATAK